MQFNNKKKKQAPDEEKLAILKNRIKEKEISGIYLFYGQEEYVKRFYFSEFERIAGRATNVTHLSSEDFSLERLLDCVNTVASFNYTDSFFDDELESATRIIKAYAPELHKLSEFEKSAILQLCDRELKGVCVVFYYPHNPKKEKDYQKSYKILADSNNVLNIDFAPYSPTSPQLKKWVKRHFESKKCTIDPVVLDYFIESVGSDMSSLLFEIEKLSAYLSQRTEKSVYTSDIDAVCIKNDNAKLDDVTRGAIEGDYVKAMTAFSILEREKMPEMYIFGAISNKISELSTIEYCRSVGMSMTDIAEKTKIKDFVIKNDIRILEKLSKRRNTKYTSLMDSFVEIVSEYDVKLKSSASDKYLLLQNMILKMVNVK